MIFPEGNARTLFADNGPRKCSVPVGPCSFEEVVPHEDGLHTYISVKISARGMPAAKPTRVCGISTNITARKQAEQEREALLRRTTAAEAKFRGLVESAPDGISDLRPSRPPSNCSNRHAESALRYRAEELAGQSVEMLLPERLQEIHRAHRTNYMAAPRARPMGVGLELLGRRKDGSEFPLEVSLSPLEAEGEFLVMSIVRDVTETQTGEEALQTQARVMDSMVEGVVVADDSGRIVLTNPSMDAMLDTRRASWSASTLAGEPLLARGEPADGGNGHRARQGRGILAGGISEPAQGWHAVPRARPGSNALEISGQH